MFEKDNQIISYALNLWANWIETGDVTISASDSISMNTLPKALTLEQQKFVVRLRELAQKELTKVN